MVIMDLRISGLYVKNKINLRSDGIYFLCKGYLIGTIKCDFLI